MKVHANAALGPAGRLALVEAIESGMTLRAAAAALNVAPATAHRWWHRWRAAGAEDRRLGRWLEDRSSRPHRQPRRLSAAEEEPILRARRQTNLGPGRLAGIVRRARSTIWKVLFRNGLSRRLRGQRQSYRRYEWSRPGALLHMDVKKLARFSVPGHRVTGDRREIAPNRGVATTTCTASSTTTAGSPMSSCIPTKTPRRTHARSNERSASSPSSASRRPRR